MVSFSASFVLLFLMGWVATNPSHSFALVPTSAATKISSSLLSATTRQRRNGRRRRRSSSNNNISAPPTDYLITDSLDLDDNDRPTVLDFAFRRYPREGFLRFPFLLCGTVLSLCNVLGVYDEGVYAPLVVSCVALGLVNAVLDATETEGVSSQARRGSIDARVLQVYAGTYSASVCWLALRVYPPVCPGWLAGLDGIFGTVASVLFVASLLVPILSLLSDVFPDTAGLEATQVGLVRLVRGDPAISDLPKFTPTERFRTVGLIVIGCVACLYLPVSSYLALYGDQWWEASLESYPQQGLLETSTALFGLIAAQSNISLTRAAGYGVRPVGEIATLGAAACLALAVVPCVSALYFLQSGTTFFDHYQYQPHY